MPYKTKESMWIRNHPLEGDNVISGFYNFLAKRNPKTLKPCRSVFVPDTIVFERNFPRGWYTTDIKECEVMRKQGKDLDASTILKGFTSNIPPSCPIVAIYLCRCEKRLESGDTQVSTQVEVFNKNTIGDFLASKTKGEGILQKFIMPKGYHNSVIQVVWSPRVCMVQRRTNKFAINDKKRAEADPFASTVTYEGPHHLSEVATVSGNVAVSIKKLCGNIVQHFYYTEHKFISRMVLYFKADKHDRLWFLWCGSFRTSDRNAYSEMPLSLAINFTEPEDNASFDEDKLLFQADHSYLRVTNDEMFYEMYMKSVSETTTSEQEKGVTYAESKLVPEDLKNEQADENDDLDIHGASFGSHLVQEALEQISYEKASILTFFEDLFYQARSHFTVFRNQPFTFVIPLKVVAALTEAFVLELMTMLHITSRACVPGDDPYQYEIRPPLKTPITKLFDDSVNCINTFYGARIDKLKKPVHKSGCDRDAMSTEANQPEEIVFM